MSLTGRPRSPPLALMSSSQIFWASKADLPLGASPPVSAMLKPILIGSPVCATARPASSAPAISAASAAAVLVDTRLGSWAILYPPHRDGFRGDLGSRGLGRASGTAPAEQPAASGALARGENARRARGDRGGSRISACLARALRRRVAAFDHDGLDLARSFAAEDRSAIVFGRGEAGDTLLERGKFDHHETVELVRPFHDAVAAAAREHLAAALGNDAGNEIGVFLVFDRIIDLGSRNPIGRHVSSSIFVDETVIPSVSTVAAKSSSGPGLSNHLPFAHDVVAERGVHA